MSTKSVNQRRSSASCLLSAASKHIYRKLSGREKFGGKGAQATGTTAVLRILLSKAESRTWESFTGNEVSVESKAITHRCLHEMNFCSSSIKPLLNQRRCQQHLTWEDERRRKISKRKRPGPFLKFFFSEKGKFCISLETQVPRIWKKSGKAQNPSF